MRPSFLHHHSGPLSRDGGAHSLALLPAGEAPLLGRGCRPCGRADRAWRAGPLVGHVPAELLPHRGCILRLRAASAHGTCRAVESHFHGRRWTWVALSLAACIWQRLSNVIFAVVPLVVLVLQAHAHAARRRELLAAAAAVGGGTLAGIGVYGIVYQYLYGSPLVFTHGRYFLQLAHAHPFLLLFDETQGLFYLTPSIWFAVLGLLPALRDRPARRLMVPLVAIAVVEIYLSSAALDWAGSRRIANLAPLWVLATCFALRAVAARVPQWSRGYSVAGMVLASPFCAASVSDAWGASRGIVPGRTTTIGTLRMLGALPAEVVFSLRYHLPRDRFREASTSEWYARDFRFLSWVRRDLPFSDARGARLTEGFSPAAGGARPLGPRAHLVFATQWPFTTHVKVRTSGGKGVRLRIGEGRAWGEPRWFGTAQALPATLGDVEFAVPPGELSSGIHEIVFDFSGDDLRTTTVISLFLDDRAPRLPAFECRAGASGRR